MEFLASTAPSSAARVKVVPLVHLFCAVVRIGIGMRVE
jgi:hypothetical protein